MTTLRIGELARQAGISRSALRYYEEAGLLRPLARSEARYRLYGADALGRIRFIGRAKALGLTLSEIRQLLDAPREGRESELASVRRLVDRKLDEVRRRRTELGALETELTAVAVRLDSSPTPGSGHLGDAEDWLAGEQERRRMADGIPGWGMQGSNPESYEAGVEPAAAHDGKRIAYLRSSAGRSTGFGTIAQQIAPHLYAGKRVRFRGSVRAEDVEGWAGLWMRVDGLGRGSHLAFDNMQDRPITGSTEWTSYDVVLDVREGATALAFGVLLAGTGRVQLSGFELEEVDRSVPTTDQGRLNRPVNLDFSMTA